MDWKRELDGMMVSRAGVTRAEQENAEFERFLDDVAFPALSEVAVELNTRHGRDAQVRRAPASVSLQVRRDDEEEITFRVMKHFVQTGILPRAEIRLNKGAMLVKYQSMFRPEPQNYQSSDVTADDIIHCFLRYYAMVMGGSSSSHAE